MGQALVESLSQAAEQLVRAGARGSLAWEGYTLSTHFQPVYCVERGGCAGYEALVRAVNDRGGALDSDRLFAEVPRERSLLLDWVCRALHLRNFATVDKGNRILFINVDPRAAVADADGAHAFANLVRYYGLTTSRLCIEILEKDCHDEGLLQEAVCAYREFGAMIAMDDYGVGRSNLDRVVALRPDIVKVDRSLLANAVGNAKARAMLPSVTQTLHLAGCKVGVEGVESATEALVAIEAGADYLQGNYFAAPAPALPDETLTGRIFAELVRVQTPRRLVSVGNA
jgi:EAL domain-containing protein (putative c-di-GMP-specific phosphodiesterase class I)